MGRFEGQTAFITGASAGIGKELALTLARQGADVAILARREEKLLALKGEIEALGRRAIAVACDVTQDGDLERAAEKTREVTGRIDIVVANAGMGIIGRFEQLTLEDYRRQFETNIYGVLRTLRATLDDVKKTKGRIAIVGSVSASIVAPGTTAYAMSKAAISALAQGLSFELAADEVSVTLLSPGFVDSEIRMIDNQGVMKTDARDPAPQFLVMPTQKAAKQMADAIFRRESERVITTHGKVAVSLQRHAPGVVATVIRLGQKRRNAGLRWDKG